jgi:hypothetical protein
MTGQPKSGYDPFQNSAPVDHAAALPIGKRRKRRQEQVGSSLFSME